MGRPQGTYITIEAPELSTPDEDYHREISEEISTHLRKLIDLEKEKSVLVIGLGNAAITADALGPQVVDNLLMTRHIIKEYGLRGIKHKKMHRISGIAPGVMAQTGMETAEIVQGIVSETKPDVVVAIDALAARSVRRLSRTIQITDTGIHPGSGVGNHRNGLTEENLQVKVIGIGVPTVVDAATIVHDSMAHLLDTLEETEQKEFLDLLTLAQSVPGPIAVNTAVFVGYKVRGLRGAAAALLGTVTPSFVIILVIAIFFAGIRQNPVVDAAFKGMRPAVVALIIGPVLTLSRGMHWTMLVVIAASALAIWWLDWSPIWILAAAAALGIAWELTMAKKVKGER